MIKIEKVSVNGLEQAIRGMRNPMNSWAKSDSFFRVGPDGHYDIYGTRIGENDYDLMERLAKAGTEHAKYRRMIVVYADIIAPLYWFKEYDTYKVGTVANSCSTMHTIHKKEFTLDDFSHEHLVKRSMNRLVGTIGELNFWRNIFLNGGQVNDEDGTVTVYQPKDKEAWWQMIQLLPSTYNQRRTVMLNYEVLTAIYRQRKGHRLDEWNVFTGWIESLPYSEIITLKEQG